MKLRSIFTNTSVAGLLAIVVFGFGASIASAQPYPKSPVRVIIPFPAGGGVDAAGRLLAQKLSETLGQTFIIDNRGGANGNIGTAIVAESTNDGMTLLFTGAGFVINPSLYKKIPFNPIKDFEPIAMMALGPNVLVVHPSLPVKSVKELIALAKAQPGKLNFAGSGNGSTPHLAGVLFNNMAGVEMVHIPYRGSGPAILGLVGGETPVMFLPAINAGPLIDSGRIRAIAVTGKERLAAFPDLPTVSSAGLEGFESNQWYGLLAPAGTSPAILNLLNAQVRKIMQTPELQAQMKKDGLVPAAGSREQFSSHIKSEISKWAKVIAASGATID